MSFRILSLAAIFALSASSAHAHLRIESHQARETESNQKTGPCGKANGRRGTKIHTFVSGETIELVVDEYIPHPGWFRISFDQDGDDDFESPKTLEPPSLMDNPTVLMDGLDMHKDRGAGGMHTWKVKLPDVECSNCTLQIIQVMLDKPPYDPQDNGALSNDLYYACLDVVLKRGSSAPSTSDASVSQTDAGSPKPSAADSGAPKGEEGASEPPTEPPMRDSGTAPVDAGTRPRVDTRDASRGGKDAGSNSQSQDVEDEEEEESEDSARDKVDEDETEADEAASAEATDGCSVQRDAGDNVATLGWLAACAGILAARSRRRRR